MKSLLISLLFILCLASINFRSNVLERYGDFKDSELCIVIPTRNEAENLPVLVERILPYGYSIIVVDDESTDGTFELAKRLAEEGKISLIERRGVRGLGSAIRVGIESSGLKLPSLSRLRLNVLMVRVSYFWLYYRNSNLEVRKSNQVCCYWTDFEPIGSKFEPRG